MQDASRSQEPFPWLLPTRRALRTQVNPPCSGSCSSSGQGPGPQRGLQRAGTILHAPPGADEALPSVTSTAVCHPTESFWTGCPKGLPLPFFCWFRSKALPGGGGTDRKRKTGLDQGRPGTEGNRARTTGCPVKRLWLKASSREHFAPLDPAHRLPAELSGQPCQRKRPRAHKRTRTHRCPAWPHALSSGTGQGAAPQQHSSACPLRGALSQERQLWAWGRAPGRPDCWHTGLARWRRAWL